MVIRNSNCRGKCVRKVQRLLNEELDINDLIIKRAYRVKAYSPKKKNQQ